MSIAGVRASLVGVLSDMQAEAARQEEQLGSGVFMHRALK